MQKKRRGITSVISLRLKLAFHKVFSLLIHNIYIWLHSNKELVEQLQEQFPDGYKPLGEEEDRRFITLFGGLLKSINVLQSFDQFEGQQLLSDGQMQDYQSNYLDLKEKWRKRGTGEKEVVNDDIIFETELIRQVEINID